MARLRIRGWCTRRSASPAERSFVASSPHGLVNALRRVGPAPPRHAVGENTLEASTGAAYAVLMSEAELLAAALLLPKPERAAMALRLVDSLDDQRADMSPSAWERAVLGEYQSRRAAHVAGDVEMVPAAEGLARVRERLARDS